MTDLAPTGLPVCSNGRTTNPLAHETGAADPYAADGTFRSRLFGIRENGIRRSVDLGQAGRGAERPRPDPGDRRAALARDRVVQPRERQARPDQGRAEDESPPPGGRADEPQGCTGAPLRPPRRALQGRRQRRHARGHPRRQVDRRPAQPARRSRSRLGAGRARAPGGQELPHAGDREQAPARARAEGTGSGRRRQGRAAQLDRGPARRASASALVDQGSRSPASRLPSSAVRNGSPPRRRRACRATQTAVRSKLRRRPLVPVGLGRGGNRAPRRTHATAASSGSRCSTSARRTSGAAPARAASTAPGFIMYVYAQVGVSLPASRRLAVRHGLSGLP